MACFFEHAYELSGDTESGGFLDRLLMLGCLTRKDDAVRMYLISCEVMEHVAVVSYQYLKKIQGCTRVPAVSCRPLITEVRVCFQASRFWVCGEQSGPWRGFIRSHIADAV